jgi:hypothetical protein
VVEVVGSNPAAPTVSTKKPFGEYVEGLFLFLRKVLRRLRGRKRQQQANGLELLHSEFVIDGRSELTMDRP